MHISALGNVWYPALINSQEEVRDIGNLTVESGLCTTGLGIGFAGSTNVEIFQAFTFDQYISNSSPGK